MDRTNVRTKEIKRVDRNVYEPLYLTEREIKSMKSRDKAKLNRMLEARKTVINSDFWEKFILVAKVALLRDDEADLYDAFEIYRTKIMGGWESSPEQNEKLDRIIAQEEAYGLAGA